MKMKISFKLLTILTLFIIIVLIYYLNIHKALYYLITIISFALFGVTVAIKLNENQLKFQFIHQKSNNDNDNDNKTHFIRNNSLVYHNYFKSKTLISKNVDQLLEQIVDLILSNYVFQWYKTLVKSDSQTFNVHLKNELWQIMARTLVRLQSIDHMKLFTTNIVNRCQKHFQKITYCWSLKDGQTTQPSASSQLSYYALSAHLANDATEIEFLRKLSDLLLSLLLPPNYAKCKPLRHLLGEIISVQVLFKSIDYLSDPNYINEKILDYLKWQSIAGERYRNTYAYAETYEDFINMINQCGDVEDLKGMAYYIVTEIMQATVINNLKRERGIDNDKGMFSGPITSAKGDQLQARNLKRYINQLRYAKNLCEKRIALIGGDKQFSDLTPDLVLPQPSKKTVLAFKIIMNSDLCRTYLRKFMQYSVMSSSVNPETRKYLLVFWESVEQLKKVNISKQYQIANEILRNSNIISSVNFHIKLPKGALKGMEEFVLGNKGPDSFYDVQSCVYDVLEHRYYPLFIVSQEYDEMMDQFMDVSENKLIESVDDGISNSRVSLSRADECDDSSLILSSDCTIEAHAFQTKTKLKAIKQKLKDKENALKALRKNEREREKLMNQTMNVNSKLIQMLEKEIDDIGREETQLENHLEWTQQWKENIGKWIVEVFSIDYNQNECVFLIVLIVRRNDCDDKSSNGWVITRTHNQFIEFRDSLVKHYPNARKLLIPKFRAKNFQMNDLKLTLIKQQIQTFFDEITVNQLISKSEEIYLFLSQSNENHRKPLSSQISYSKNRPGKLPFANLFGINSQQYSINEQQIMSSDDEQQLDKFLILDDLEVKENTKDDIANPLYNLFSEIFELRGGVFNLLRRTLITFVQVTYGKSIDKQLRDTVEWLCSESMVYYYLNNFKNSFWPNDCLAEPIKEVNSDEKRRIQMLSKQMLINSIPELIVNFLGHNNAKNGVSKVFDALQNKKLNKQLFYELIETFIFEFAPELRNK